jgi:predicted nucleotidyltransferase component of viral defense system
MRKLEIKSFINKLKEKHKLEVSDNFLEKDYILSLFLSNWEKSETPNLDKLIFKGGTLLTKNYLNYHRISEDLDFIHQDSNEIRIIKTNQKRETQIKTRVIPIIEERKIIEFLMKNNNSCTQYELTKIEGMTKLKVHRGLEKLEQKSVISKEKLGKINKIYLISKF